MKGDIYTIDRLVQDGSGNSLAIAELTNMNRTVAIPGEKQLRRQRNDRADISCMFGADRPAEPRVHTP